MVFISGIRYYPSLLTISYVPLSAHSCIFVLYANCCKIIIDLVAIMTALTDAWSMHEHVGFVDIIESHGVNRTRVCTFLSIDLDEVPLTAVSGTFKAHSHVPTPTYV